MGDNDEGTLLRKEIHLLRQSIHELSKRLEDVVRIETHQHSQDARLDQQEAILERISAKLSEMTLAFAVVKASVNSSEVWLRLATTTVITAVLMAMLGGVLK